MGVTIETLRDAGFLVRPASIEDAQAATDFFNACEIAEFGEPDYVDGEVESEWSGRDLANEVTLIIGPAATPVGSLTLDHHGHVVVDADFYVHPDHKEHGLDTFLIRLSEEKGKEHVALAPPDTRVVLRIVVNGQNSEDTALLESLGFTAIRYFYRMVIDLTEPPAKPDWPAGLSVRPHSPGDERAMFATVNEAFQDHWSMGPITFEEWDRRRKAEGADPSLWFQVFEGSEMVAAVLCKILGEMGWVNNVGVRRPWRKRGIATALLKHVFGEFYRRGLTRVGLGVDAQNATGATRLYERIGMRQVRQFTFYEKVLRDGAHWHEGEEPSTTAR